jgi:succinate dehydrogenase/fumarate reductase flavoprotein subunit
MSTKRKNEGMDRREFIKGAALAGAGALTLSALMSGNVEAKGSAPQKWTMEADVIIVGFGGAGACAAIEAHDAGAKVLILEKQPEKRHYPNTRMSGGIFHSPDPTGDRAALKEYAKAMFSGENLPWKLEGEEPEVSDELAEAWAEYSPKNIEFMRKIDPDFNAAARGSAAFPNFPGAKASKYASVRSTYTGRMSYEYPTKDLPKKEKMAGEAFFTCLKTGVENRKIKVLYETPVKSLVVGKGKEIIGVISQSGKSEISCKAKKAVILTSGGYEYNMAMRKAFLEGPGVEGWAFYGSPDNTGDGIEMGMAVGAGLMKAGKAAARIITAVPIRHHGMKMGVITDSVGSPNSIVVDSYGDRYAAESLITDDPSRYFFYKEALKFDITKLLYPRVPSWMIFDETMRTKTTVTYMAISTVGYGFVPWTKDNMDAINRGWILKGDTMEELAAKIRAFPENRKLMDSGKLSSSVLRFNEFCKKGKDDDFGRKVSSLAPIEKPPYYALPLYPGGPNTKGGLAANAKREVLDWKLNPIPRLYTAGEISSALKFVYQGGGNLTECIVFGRIAGKNAAALKPWK